MASDAHPAARPAAQAGRAGRDDASARMRGRVLLLYALLSFACLLGNAGLLARDLHGASLPPVLFFVGALVDSCFQYLAVALLPVAVAHLALAALERQRGPLRGATAGVYALAVALGAALQIGIYGDRLIFEIFGFHVNGFVVNLILTPGGIASMGGDEASTRLFAGIAAAFVALQAALLALALRASRRREAPRWLRPRALLAGLAAMLGLTAVERMGYAVSHLVEYTPVLDAASALPGYLPVTIQGIARFLGVQPARSSAPHFHVASDRLSYPLHPIARGPHRTLNVVWLVSESLRADMLDPEIMPATHAFARRALWFRTHYSGGNGTRMGMFSMFYGLYGSYWFPFLQHRRQPVLLDVLQQDGYQLGLFTSANFSYPEFDKTLFSGVPSQQLHAFSEGPTWQRDRHNVGELLSFIERRDPARPFMAFMFFESPHARYEFPPESVIRRPYLEELNYANLKLEKNIGLIFNRYVNACHHLDSQLARVIAYLEQHALLASTLVVITGDHGESFMEKGRWGHGSDFSDVQTRVPLVLWIPGEAPREITRMTSHLDIAPTVLARLGVTNPPEDYSAGFDLLGERTRSMAVLADWNTLAVVDGRSKLIFPMHAAGFLQRRHATTADDVPLSESESRALLEANPQRWLDVMHDLAKFSGRG
jgi:membrane-anchored protein YejM (alkaline phosphatase superfamily)